MDDQGLKAYALSLAVSKAVVGTYHGEIVENAKAFYEFLQPETKKQNVEGK